MISAKEAKELYDLSGVEVEEYLAKIEPKIIEAAKSGKRSIEIDCGCERTYAVLEKTQFDRSLLSKLGSLGYTAKKSWISGPYVPRGLADESGNGPMHVNVGYIISW